MLEEKERKLKQEQTLFGKERKEQEDIAMEDEADDRAAALRLIAENKKASVFRDAT